MSSRDPQLVGISTKLYDQYGSIGQCSRVAHKQHEGKPGSEMEDWTKRNGYGQVPAYLKSAARQPRTIRDTSLTIRDALRAALRRAAPWPEADED